MALEGEQIETHWPGGSNLLSPAVRYLFSSWRFFFSAGIIFKR